MPPERSHHLLAHLGMSLHIRDVHSEKRRPTRARLNLREGVRQGRVLDHVQDGDVEPDLRQCEGCRRASRQWPRLAGVTRASPLGR